MTFSINDLLTLHCGAVLQNKFYLTRIKSILSFTSQLVVLGRGYHFPYRREERHLVVMSHLINIFNIVTVKVPLK